MTTLTVEIPDKLAKEAEDAGLLSAERIETLLREQLRAQRIERLQTAREKLAANPLPPMTAEEIQTEIRAYRNERRHASGS